MSDREKLTVLKAEAETSCTYRVRALALADDEVDQSKLLLEIGFFAGRATAIEELMHQGD